MPNLRDAAEVLRLCEGQRAKMVDNWRENGRFEMGGLSSAYLLIITELLGEKLPMPMALPAPASAASLAHIPPEHHTEAISQALRSMARRCGAIGVVMCAEMWLVETTGARSVEEAERLRAEMPRSLEHAPGRKEGLMMLLDHVATGPRMWTATIERNPTKLGPWKRADGDGYAGRFAGIIQSGS